MLFKKVMDVWLDFLSCSAGALVILNVHYERRVIGDTALNAIAVKVLGLRSVFEILFTPFMTK